jgi:hypothetical protein
VSVHPKIIHINLIPSNKKCSCFKKENKIKKMLSRNQDSFHFFLAGAAALGAGGSSGCPLSFPRSLIPIALSIFPRIC